VIKGLDTVLKTISKTGSTDQPKTRERQTEAGEY